MRELNPPFILTADERMTPVWRKLVAHMEAKLAELRESNDGDYGQVDTAKLRGRIAMLRELLQLDKELDPNAPVPFATDF